MIARVGGVPCKASDFSVLFGVESENTITEHLLSKLDYEHAIAFPSGRTALAYALKFAGIDEDDEVIVPGYTCYSVKRAVQSVSTPVYADIGNDFCIDIEDAVEKISPNTAAIVPVHTFGKPSDMHAIRDLADDHDLTVVEDAAHALGTTHLSDKVGSCSEFCFFSFRFSKEATAYKGGLLFSERALSVEDGNARSDIIWPIKLGTVLAGDHLRGFLPGSVYHSLQKWVVKPFFTSSSNTIGTLSAIEFSDSKDAFLGHQYEQLADEVTARRRNAKLYNELLSGVRKPPSDDGHSFYRYPILVNHNRDMYSERLRKAGVGCSSMYSYTIAPDGECPTADSVSQRILNLPVHGRLSQHTIQKIAEIVQNLTSDISG